MSTARHLWPLAGATMHITRSAMHLQDTDEMETIPLPCFLLEHERGLILFDTGVRPDTWTIGMKGAYGDALDTLPIQCPPGNDLQNQLALTGHTVDDVTHVIISHAHLDHTGGMYLFPNAKFYMGEEELPHAFWPHRSVTPWFGRDDIDRVRDANWNPIGYDLDLFGDGSVQIIRTPGHTPGSLSVMVKLATRSFLLTGDVAHTRVNFDDEVICPGDLNTTEAYRSIQRLKQLADAHQADVWVMHDKGDWERFASPWENYAGASSVID